MHHQSQQLLTQKQETSEQDHDWLFNPMPRPPKQWDMSGHFVLYAKLNIAYLYENDKKRYPLMLIAFKVIHLQVSMKKKNSFNIWLMSRFNDQ